MISYSRGIFRKELKEKKEKVQMVFQVKKGKAWAFLEADPLKGRAVWKRDSFKKERRRAKAAALGNH